MRTYVTERGQISIPSQIRKVLHIQPGTGIEWIVTGEGIYMLPVPDDPIAAFRGKHKGRGLLKSFLKHRQEERKKDW